MSISLNVELTGRLQKMLYSIVHPDFSNLMNSIRVAMDEDHVKGIMAGKDKDGNTTTPVTYRNGVIDRKLVKAMKKQAINNWRYQAPIAIDAADANLTTAEYKKLSGPPLAPRGLNSRIIRNYATQAGFDGNNWWVEAALIDIVNKKGNPFMQYHFEGSGRLPQRDMRGIRPEGMTKIRKLVALEIRRQFFERD